jgi:hypothetical protein
MYANEKMKPVETIAVMEEGRIKENDEGSECTYDKL